MVWTIRHIFISFLLCLYSISIVSFSSKEIIPRIETIAHHPCESFLDVKTISERNEKKCVYENKTH